MLFGWPRCCSCFLGVFLPLNILVIVSLLSGMLFGALEMTAEVTANDAVMRRQQTELELIGHLDDVLQQLPELCRQVVRT